MLKIALTGGIGSGKSEVAACFARLKVPIIDADKIAHELVKKGHAAHRTIGNHFDKNIYQKNGELDRAKLRTQALAKVSARRWLEKLLHPLIYQEIIKQLKTYRKAPYVILVIPILFETHFKPLRALADVVLVVDLPKTLQIKRLKQARPQLSNRDIKAFLNTQISRNERRKYADIIITNQGSRKDLASAIKEIHLLLNG